MYVYGLVTINRDVRDIDGEALNAYFIFYLYVFAKFKKVLFSFRFDCAVNVSLVGQKDQ